MAQRHERASRRTFLTRPAQAIRFRPRVGRPVPEVIGNACTGCGACAAPCPAGAILLAARNGEAVHA